MNSEKGTNKFWAVMLAMFSGIAVYYYIRGGKGNRTINTLVSKYGPALMPVVGSILGSIGSHIRNDTRLAK